MTSKIRDGILYTLLIMLILFGPAVVVYSYFNPAFNTVTFLSAGSTYAVALLTVAYVLTTSKQLDVMAAQLEETKHDRELQNQPLPWVQNIKMHLETPRVYFCPPIPPKKEPDYQFLSRYVVEYKVINIGSFPSLSVDLSARIELTQDGEPLYLDAVSNRIDVLEPGKSSPDKSLLFAGDESGLLIKMIRGNNVLDYPLLLLRIVYRNVVGGYFVIYNRYRIYPKDENQDLIFKNWISQMASFPHQFKDELETLKWAGPDRKDELFQRIKTESDKTVSGGDVELHLESIPGSFNVRIISKEEYIKLTENASYGLLMSVGGLCSCSENNADM